MKHDALKENRAPARENTGATARWLSYASSTNPQRAAEAEAFIAWRDAALVHMFEQLAAVEASETAPPTIEGFIGGITPIVWPSP
ncbi:hypothetical protein NOJ28_26540 [Neorhizobium galegae]|uniref:hypothetical protein n=1 Tax=Neorhizobium galegae TaxID=399 RepID=UPI00062248A7|nr:hypothetical protein [Neorhizobium galegae]MCQ1769092.1 hypothetical protein [Neorhizobium galegae]MCQ1846257.1 hypothetical protein [Neorhizobium galegae]CDZ38050.1 Hypothetical protein NGAL_HAMBI1146_26770 [Neorhizobium galegae bv. officinalis]